MGAMKTGIQTIVWYVKGSSATSKSWLPRAAFRGLKFPPFFGQVVKLKNEVC